MDTSHLTVTVRRQRSAAMLDLRGDIDGFAEQALAGGYAEAERGIPRAILLNFAQVHYINSTGIALIVDLVAKARASGRPLLAYGLSDHFVEVFKITRLSDFVGLHDTEAAAIADAERIDDRQRAGA